MTVIQVDLRDSGDSPLVGYIGVTLDYRLNTDSGKSLQPVIKYYPLTNGQVTLDLVPSELAKVSYYFEVFQTTMQGSTPVDVRIDDFHATVPDYITPIKWTELARQTDITKNDQDSSLLSVVRRLLSYSDFWTGVSQHTFKPKGIYSSNAYYNIGDIVSFNGNGYLNISLTSLTNEPPNPNGDNAVWKLLVRKGDTGAGTTGDNTPYNPSVWVDSIAPSRSAVKDIVQQLATKTELTGILTSPVISGNPTLTAAIPSNDNSTRLASTQWTQALVTSLLGSIIPVGTVTTYAGTSAPNGWVLCDGRVLLRASFPALFAIIGTTYNTGSETGLQFRVPDLRGRTPFAPDNMGTNGVVTRLGASALNVSGGVSTVTLTTAQIPSHNHRFSGIVINPPTGGSTGIFALTSGTAAPTATNVMGNSATGSDSLGAIQFTGSNNAHENLPPYLTLNYIIYCGV